MKCFQRLPLRVTSALAVISLGISLTAQAQTYKEDIGYNQLASELGASLPDGSGIRVIQVEAPEGGNYMPDTTNGQFSGKTISGQSGASLSSSHATTVGSYQYGNTTSVAAGITEVDVFEANNWIGSGFLRSGSNSAPLVASGRVINHSWIGTAGASDPEILRRFDFVISRDNLLSVAGLNNGSGSSVPNLLAASYNGLVAGRSDGNHSSGTTQVDSASRAKPDLVVPIDATSWAAPITAAAGAMLIEHAVNTPGLAVAANTEVIKAALMAGATKEESFNWSHSETSPLDDTYGAGELNIYNSYHIIDAGPQPASSSANVGLKGWHFNNSSNSSNLIYFFEVPEGETLEEFSLVLTWNRLVTDGVPGPNWGNPTVELKNLDLRFYSATNFVLGEQLDASLSTVDNVEHIYRTKVQSGQYAVEVDAAADGNQDADYAVAWTATAVPEPTVGMLVLMACVGGALRRRR